MIEVNSYTLSNGLKLLHHKDATTQMVALNLLYKVGAKNEVEGKTGFAHLFEHLMFGGSANVKSFDGPLQAAGGTNNAWTSNDVTNFYDVLPAHNVETAFWLESDRLLQLAFTQKALDTQKSVVIEEFKQRCLNVPYGDMQHHLRAAAYKVHPYRWPVIGQDVAQIEAVTLDTEKDFFYSNYGPDNLIMCVAGNISFEQAVALTEKWFGDIPSRNIKQAPLPEEPKQTEARVVRVEKDVPQKLITRAYHMCGRRDKDYQATDIVTDLLSNGNSARFYQNVLLKTDVFTDLDASIQGCVEPGLLLISGRLRDGVSYEQGLEIIDNEIQKFLNEEISQYEITKYVNKYDSNECFENISYLKKATNLCRYELYSNANDINTEIDKYRAITPDDIRRVASDVFRAENCTTLLYGK